MESKLKSWKPTEKDWLNDVKPRLETPFPHELKQVPVVNDLGEEIGQKPASYDPTLSVKDDKNVPERPELSMDSNNPAAFAAAAALMQGSADVHTSGLSPLGADDADAMTIVSSLVNPSSDE